MSPQSSAAKHGGGDRGGGLHRDLQRWNERARGECGPASRSEKSPVPDAEADATIDGRVRAPGWDENSSAPVTRLALVNDVINADKLWSHGVDGSGIGVAVIDSGVAPVPGLDGAGKLINGADLSFDSQSDATRYLDAYGHGTHMASIIAGNDGTKRGFRGVAPGAHIVNVKVGATDGSVDVSQVIAAIDWTVQHRNDPGLNIRVISLSYGTDSLQGYQIDPLTTAVESAWRNGIVVVVSGGNGGTIHPSLTDPATDPYVLAVGAADIRGTANKRDDRVADFSSRGNAARSVDVVAPGVSIAGLRDPGSMIDDLHPDAVVDGRFFRGSGTSQATAITAGAVALLLDARPDLTPDMVKAILRKTATPIDGAKKRDQGAGMINVREANAASVDADRPAVVADGHRRGIARGGPRRRTRRRRRLRADRRDRHHGPAVGRTSLGPPVRGRRGVVRRNMERLGVDRQPVGRRQLADNAVDQQVVVEQELVGLRLVEQELVGHVVDRYELDQQVVVEQVVVEQELVGRQLEPHLDVAP